MWISRDLKLEIEGGRSCTSSMEETLLIDRIYGEFQANNWPFEFGGEFAGSWRWSWRCVNESYEKLQMEIDEQFWFQRRMESVVDLRRGIASSNFMVTRISQLESWWISFKRFFADNRNLWWIWNKQPLFSMDNLRFVMSLKRLDDDFNANFNARSINLMDN